LGGTWGKAGFDSGYIGYFVDGGQEGKGRREGLGGLIKKQKTETESETQIVGVRDFEAQGMGREGLQRWSWFMDIYQRVLLHSKVAW
jgi:hypothetical protein